MLIHPVCHSLYRNFRCPPVREMKDTRGNAAEGDTFDLIFQAQIQCAAITFRQVLLQGFRKPAGYDRPHDVDYLFSGKVVSVSQHRHSRRLLIIRTVLCPEFLNLSAALRPQLYSGEGMNAVRDTYLNHTYLILPFLRHHHSQKTLRSSPPFRL